MSTPLVIAHRGNSSLTPENTLAAFETSWRADADMIELDIQLSSDGRAVVIHNDTLDETTSGSGSVAHHTADQVRALDAGSWFAPAFAGERVPLLTDVLQWLNERQGIELLLEFKGEWDAAPVSRVIDELEAAGVGARTVVQSFSATTVQVLADVAPDIRRGLLVANVTPSVFSECARLRTTQCNPWGTVLGTDPGLIERIHDAGMQAMVWTANTPAEWRTLVDLGVDGIITDRPHRLRGFLDALT